MSDGFVLYEALRKMGRVFLLMSDISPSVSSVPLCRCHCRSADGTLGSLPFSCSPWLDSFINCTVVVWDDMRGRGETQRAKRKQCLISSGCHSCSAISKATQDCDAGHWPSPTSSCLLFRHTHTEIGNPACLRGHSLYVGPGLSIDYYCIIWYPEITASQYSTTRTPSCKDEYSGGWLERRRMEEICCFADHNTSVHMPAWPLSQLTVLGTKSEQTLR